MPRRKRSADPGDPALWRARKARAEALLAERRLAELEGRLVPRESIIRAVRALAASVVDEVRAEPLVACPEVTALLGALPVAQQELLRQAVADWEARLLRRLAESGPARALAVVAQEVADARAGDG